MKKMIYTSLTFIFTCCLTINLFAQITPETALMHPEVETIIGLQMPGGNDIMSTINIVSDVDDNTAIINTYDSVEPSDQITGNLNNDASANVDNELDPIDIDEEIEKEELIIREGIITELDNKLVLYPNPAINFINMEMEETGLYNVEIYNLIGSLIYSNQVEIGKNASLRVDLQDYHTGMYILNVSNSNMAVTKKFAIKK